MSHIIIITYYSGTQNAYFKNDPQLLEDLIFYHEDIEDVQEIPFSGTIQKDNERVMRALIKKHGKVATRELLDRICQESK